MRVAVKPCVNKIKECNEGKDSACTSAYTECNLALTSPYQATGMNPYDMRSKCEVKPLCYDFSNVGVYLSQPGVKTALGVDADREWSSCNMDVNRMFMGDWMKNYQQELPDMLLDDARVLVYAGDQDYICNWIGNKQWTLAMDWEHHDEYNAATDDAYRL